MRTSDLVVDRFPVDRPCAPAEASGSFAAFMSVLPAAPYAAGRTAPTAMKQWANANRHAIKGSTPWPLDLQGGSTG